MNMLPFEITLDWSWVYNLGSQPFHVILWHFFVNGGWVLFLVVGLWGAWHNFVYWRQSIYSAKQSYIFLAIDIPKENLQTPKAVENIFTALAGSQQPLDWHELTFKGNFQLSYSFEIVSIDGFIQYLIRTPVQFRNLVEAAVYGQYPEAEITEVEDYTADINVNFPSDEYNIWGADLVFTNKEYHPIKTYISFKEELDSEFKDPMAAVLEVMSAIGPGEQIWLQLIAAPASIGWEKEGFKEVDKLMGVKAKSKPSILGKILDAPIAFLNLFGEQIIGQPVLGMGEAVEEKAADSRFLDMLPPVEKMRVDGIVNKVDKVCFKGKYRLVYFGKRDVFKKGLGVSGMMGAIKQYGSTALNGFKPGKNKTQAKLAFKNSRLHIKQNAILENFKSRNGDTCDGKQLMSVEELATLFHFPHIEVRAPLVKRTESRRSRAPIGLPISEDVPVLEDSEAEDLETPKVGDKVPVVDYDNDYFEQRFAKDKTGKTDKARKAKIIKELKEKGALPDAETVSDESEIKSHDDSAKDTDEINKADDDNSSFDEESIRKDRPQKEDVEKIDSEKDPSADLPGGLPFVD
ncbi:hypothetical protein HOM83_04430 [Candidatus Falkowbacteria bacterium]|nr:hypothetical protein [Candidatus Falkowbacteria bacterium]